MLPFIGWDLLDVSIVHHISKRPTGRETRKRRCHREGSCTCHASAKRKQWNTRKASLLPVLCCHVLMSNEESIDVILGILAQRHDPSFYHWTVNCPRDPQTTLYCSKGSMGIPSIAWSKSWHISFSLRIWFANQNFSPVSMNVLKNL